MKRIICKWYFLEILNDKGKWVDAGDVYHDDRRGIVRREMCFVNFAGHKVRMVECVSVRKGVVAEKFFPMR